MADLKQAGGAVDINLLEQGRIAVWYDNSGYICEAYWVRGRTFFTHCEHEEVLPLVDMSQNLCGFMIQGVEWISQDAEGYVTVDLKSNLPKNSGGPDSGEHWATTTTDGEYLNPIEQGIIGVKFDRNAHFCEVRWGNDNATFMETDNEYILAAVDSEGILSGFKIINTDQLAENPMGCVGAELKVRVESAAIIQAGESQP